MNVTELIEHFDFLMKDRRSIDWVELGPMEVAELELVRSGLHLLRRQEQNDAAATINRRHTYAR